MNSVVTRQNFRQLPELVELLAGLKVKQAQLAFVHPMGNAQENFDEIVPSFAEAMPCIYKAIETAKKAGLPLMVEAVPLCLMQGYESFSSEQYIPETEIREVNEFTPSFTRARKEEGKKKGPNCKECRYFNVCEGPWKEYPEKRGFLEFTPVKGKKIKSLEEFACQKPTEKVIKKKSVL
jgi:radical SAM protein with 4Fe4S-binding SPASM domain